MRLLLLLLLFGCSVATGTLAAELVESAPPFFLTNHAITYFDLLVHGPSYCILEGSEMYQGFEKKIIARLKSREELQTAL